MLTWRGERNFGSFEKLFQGHFAPYKFLLSIDGTSTDAVIAVRDAVNESSNLAIELQTLLDDIDWRSHLVAGTALLFAEELNLSTNLWMAFDRGSWVSPQLAGFLYFHDSQFSTKAKEHLENRCPIKYEFVEPIGEQELSLLSGPKEKQRFSHKGMASLLGICSIIPNLREYVLEMASYEDVGQILEKEDWGQWLVEWWLPEVQRCYKKFGINLVRAES